jgi:hypothetical protein
VDDYLAGRRTDLALLYTHPSVFEETLATDRT